MIGLPFDMSTTQNGPAMTNSSATLSSCMAVPMSSVYAASLHQLSKMRSSMKHTTSAVTTGVLPVTANNQLR
ncbi:MAG: hypothetical protein BWY79_02224 [Actinobacteria bacterium ADurb.Bin444]|nr:MAG: hypothetical protein BWY79_02224 [Actinobacteria bacterium ADurb.Bin444]